jgi:hypothetical protein
MTFVCLCEGASEGLRRRMEGVEMTDASVRSSWTEDRHAAERDKDK